MDIFLHRREKKTTLVKKKILTKIDTLSYSMNMDFFFFFFFFFFNQEKYITMFIQRFFLKMKIDFRFWKFGKII